MTIVGDQQLSTYTDLMCEALGTRDFEVTDVVKFSEVIDIPVAPGTIVPPGGERALPVIFLGVAVGHHIRGWELIHFTHLDEDNKVTPAGVVVLKTFVREHPDLIFSEIR